MKRIYDSKLGPGVLSPLFFFPLLEQIPLLAGYLVAAYLALLYFGGQPTQRIQVFFV